ncbi:cytochrome P450 [Lophiotrema nucula]|uniref:Cytochrome P450 n=1 Tax=Lophiotrema nucula TaxID=690887 RepID=A0A6A5ZCG5_9PLEO|nr:cytochrome P450 [Lophiotrema nucula]
MVRSTDIVLVTGGSGFLGSHIVDAIIAEGRFQVVAYHLLSKNPDILVQLRDEHDRVFVPETSTTANRLKEDPSLLNKCKPTQAIIKETLRLYAPAATMRIGNAECSLKTQRGVTVPADNFAILMQNHSIHRNTRLWPRADEFLPERWLVGPEHELKFPKVGAWRPVELGPRNCIGQALSMNEIKVVLVMTVRNFDIKPAYEDFDMIQAKGKGWPGQLLGTLGFGRKKPGIEYGLV